MTVLVDRLLTEIGDIEANNAKRVEFSMKRAGEFCGKFLDRLGIHE